MDIQHQRCLVNVRKEQGVVALLGLYFCLFNQYNSFFFSSSSSSFHHENRLERVGERQQTDERELTQTSFSINITLCRCSLNCVAPPLVASAQLLPGNSFI